MAGRCRCSSAWSARSAAALLGTVIGLIAGYAAGRTDALLMRLTDAVIALPLLPLLIVLAAVDLGKLGVPAAVAQSEGASLYRILLIVALVGWTTVARLVRGAALSVRERDYVRAAVALGAGRCASCAATCCPTWSRRSSSPPPSRSAT